MSNFSGISRPARPVDKDDRDLIIREDDGQIGHGYGFFKNKKSALNWRRDCRYSLFHF